MYQKSISFFNYYISLALKLEKDCPHFLHFHIYKKIGHYGQLKPLFSYIKSWGTFKPNPTFTVEPYDKVTSIKFSTRAYNLGLYTSPEQRERAIKAFENPRFQGVTVDYLTHKHTPVE